MDPSQCYNNNVTSNMKSKRSITEATIDVNMNKENCKRKANYSNASANTATYDQNYMI